MCFLNTQSTILLTLQSVEPFKCFSLGLQTPTRFRLLQRPHIFQPRKYPINLFNKVMIRHKKRENWHFMVFAFSAKVFAENHWLFCFFGCMTEVLPFGPLIPITLTFLVSILTSHWTQREPLWKWKNIGSGGRGMDSLQIKSFQWNQIEFASSLSSEGCKWGRAGRGGRGGILTAVGPFIRGAQKSKV